MKNALFFLLVASVALAHQPRIVEGSSIVEISNPEISQAFYGDLNGTPAEFEIKSGSQFRLYVGITVPDVPGARTDKSVEVLSVDDNGRETRLFLLNGTGNWEPFFEEFAGDQYFQGPEGRGDVSAGTYRIRVSSPDNQGKYALAVGEEEAFGPMDTVDAIVLIPRLKSWFFGKSPFDALFTRIYLFAFLSASALAAALAIALWTAWSFLSSKASAGLKGKVLLIFASAAAVIGIALFVPAGTLDYWQAWMYMATILLPASIVIAYFMRNDPAFLERRFRTKEKEARQQLIIKGALVIFIIGFLLPGLDRRFGWSPVPAEISLAADALVFSGYIFIFQVFRENSYAGRTIQVEKGQKVITTGLYGIIRHPMYLGSLVLYLATPVALGSYVAVLPFLFNIPIFVLRILNEEEVLRRELPGYVQYCEKTRYRLVPFVW